MKPITIIVVVLFMIACNNKADTTKSSDTTTINTNTGNLPEGGPNNGLGDTTSYNRANDTIVHDSLSKNPAN